MDFSERSAELLHQIVTIMYGLDAEDALHSHVNKAAAIKEMSEWMLSTWNDGYNCGYAEGRNEY